MVMSNNIDKDNPESLENQTTLNQEEVQEDSELASSDSVSEDIKEEGQEDSGLVGGLAPRNIS